MRMRHGALALVLLAACVAEPPVTSADVQARYEAATQAFENDFTEFERTAARGQPFAGNLEPMRDFLRTALRQRRDQDARELAGVYLASLGSYGTPPTAQDYQDVVEAVPPSSRHWSASPINAFRGLAAGLPTDQARTYFNAVADQNPDRASQGWALLYLAQVERRESQADAFAATYARLEPYQDVETLNVMISMLNPSNRVAPGKPVPAWSFEELGTDRVINSESLRGRYYLLDFWATWCGPCLGERAALTQLQERYGGDRFTIVSVSMDNAEQEAIDFRERRWPMDWVNVYAPGVREGERVRWGPVADLFELRVSGLPQLVLVSPEGEVLALRDQLDRTTLEQTVARYLESAQ